jgi:hypothetical protein
MLSAFVGYGNIHGAVDHTQGEQPELDLKSGEVESPGQSPQSLSLRWTRVQGNAGLKEHLEAVSPSSFLSRVRSSVVAQEEEKKEERLRQV